MKSCMENAPTRMRTASLRDKPLRKGMVTINCPDSVNDNNKEELRLH